MNGERLAFEPFGSLDGILRGDPFKIFPQGRWHRGDRVIDITAERLREFATNLKAGLPRFRVPINLDHEQTQGKVGTVHDVEYLPAGAEGPGLYATRYDLTDKGKKALGEDGYDAVSGEAIWTLLNDAKYQDPETGREHDNVLAGVAFTPTPYFGHNHVALFSANPPGPAKRRNGYTRLRELMRQKFEELMAMVKDEDGDGEPDMPMDEGERRRSREEMADNFRDFSPEQRRELADKGLALTDGSFPIVTLADLSNAVQAWGRASNQALAKKHIIKRAKALGATDRLPEDWTSESTQGVDSMTDKSTTPQAPALAPEPEKFAVTAEEFAALKAKADKAALLEEQFAALKTQAEATATALATEKRTRRLEQLNDRVERFVALPAKADELAEKLLALEEKDAALFAYFIERLEAADKALIESDLFSQKASARITESADSFEAAIEQELKEHFGGDRARYSEAMAAVTAKRPQLAQAYKARG